MKVLIIENEIYLAQSIASKLSEMGYTCDMSSSTQEGLKGIDYDVVLLSTNISGQNIYPVIEAYRNSVIILMVSYISNDTVSKPLAAGAKDYILKPFMIEELIRKIEHFQDYNRLKNENRMFRRYIHHHFQGMQNEHEPLSQKLPLFIASNFQKYMDHFAFEYAHKNNKPMQFLSLEHPDALEELDGMSTTQLIYVCDYQALRKQDRKRFFDLIARRQVIVASTDQVDGVDYPVIEIKSDSACFDQGDILPIEDYVKYIVLNYQHKFPDTELSKKLGISRKSLWEKRKKYGIVKKK